MSGNDREDSVEVVDGRIEGSTDLDGRHDRPALSLFPVTIGRELAVDGRGVEELMLRPKASK